jgi:hypothetical protein
VFMFMSLLAFVLSSDAEDSCERFQVVVDTNLASLEDVGKDVRKLLRGDAANIFDISYTIEPRANPEVDMMLHFHAGASGEILVTRTRHDGVLVSEINTPKPVTVIDGRVSMSIAARALIEFNLGCGDVSEIKPKVEPEPGVNSDANSSTPSVSIVINNYPPNPTNNPPAVRKLSSVRMRPRAKAAQDPIVEMPRDAVTLEMVAVAVTTPTLVTAAIGFISAGVLDDTDGKYLMLGIGIGSSVGVIIGAGFGFAAFHAQQKAKAKNKGVVLVPSVAPRRGGAQLGFTLRF